MLSGRGLCDELITRPEESYRLWCVVLCDLENLMNDEAMTRVGSQRHRKKIYIYADANDRAVYDVGLRALALWDCGFESRQGLGCLSVVSVLCCQGKVCGSG